MTADMMAPAAQEFLTDKAGFLVETCTRCDGHGRIDAYGNVYGGVCFGCGGAGARHPKGKVGQLAADYANAVRAARTTILSTWVTIAADGTRTYDTAASVGDQVRLHNDQPWRTVAEIRHTRRMIGWGTVGDRMDHIKLENWVTFTNGDVERCGGMLWKRRPNADALTALRLGLVAQAQDAYRKLLARRAKAGR